MNVLLVVAVLAASNVVSNRVLPDALYVPWNLCVAGLVVGMAWRLDGRSFEEIGLGRAAAGRGVRLGVLVVALVAGAYLVAAVLPATRDVFEDRRVEDLGLAGMLYAALVRVPLGTVLLEEVAFRGVLPAMLEARLGVRPAVTLSAGLFGLWHVLPSTGLGDRNAAVEEVLGDAGVVVVVASAVVATALAGVGLWLLRRWSDSLAAPALTHWSTNGLGYLFAYFIAPSS